MTGFSASALASSPFALVKTFDLPQFSRSAKYIDGVNAITGLVFNETVNLRYSTENTATRIINAMVGVIPGSHGEFFLADDLKVNHPPTKVCAALAEPIADGDFDVRTKHNIGIGRCRAMVQPVIEPHRIGGVGSAEVGKRGKMHVDRKNIPWIRIVIDTHAAAGIRLLLGINAVPD